MNDITETNRGLLTRYHEEVWEKGNLAAAREFIGPGFRSHAVQQGVDMGELRRAFPDLMSHADVIMADGNHVAIVWTITATHRGEFKGIKPTGRKIHVQGMDVLRAENGKFVEHWGGYNDQIQKMVKLLSDEPAAH